MPVPMLDLKAQYSTIKDEVVRAMMGVVESQLFILGEPVGPRTLLATPLIVGAVALVVYSKARADRAAAGQRASLEPAK